MYAAVPLSSLSISQLLGLWITPIHSPEIFSLKRKGFPCAYSILFV